MKLCILCDREDRTAADDIASLLRSMSLPGTVIPIDPEWKSLAHRLDETLSAATHIIVIYSDNSVDSDWLVFAAGYCLGTDRPMVLYRPSRLPLQQLYLSPFFLILSLEDMGTFLESERQEWTEVAGRREARRELLDLGVSFRPDAFAASVKEGNSHAVDLFLKAGMSADTRDRNGVPMLCIAAREGQRALVDLLIERNAGLDLQSEDRGNSALMDAVASGHIEIARHLLAAGASVDLASKDGQTALVIAVGKGNASLVELLMQTGADADLNDKLGLSARKYAQLFHNESIMRLFPPTSSA